MTVVGGHATVGRLSNNDFSTFQAIRNFFEKSRWTVTRQWSEVTRPSADCQTTFFGRFKRFGKILKKVAERSRDSGRRSRDRRPTVKQRFLDVSSDLGEFWKKSLNGHATVVEVTRPSADCQTTFFGRFKRFGKILKKVAERSRDSGRRSRDRRPTVKQRFLDVSSDLGKFWKKSLNGHATVVEVTRPSADCQTTFFGRFKRFGRILKKVAERSRDSGRRSRDRRPTVKQRFLDVSSDLGKFWKKSLNGHATVVEVTRPSADCQTTFFGRFKRFGKILKKVAERSRDSGWGHATVGRLSNNVFSTFQAIWENFEKSRWTVTRQWLRSRDRRPTVKQRFLDVSSDLGKFWKKSLNGHATVVEVTRPSADCQTTFFGRFKRFGKILKKVAERSRDSGWGHATVGRLSNNVFWTFQAIWENFEKSRWTVTRQWLRSRDRRPTVKQRFLDVSSDLGKFWKKSLNGHATVVEVTRPSADCQTTFFGRFKRFGKILKKVAERSRDSGRRSRDRRPTVKQRFLDVSSDLGKFWKKSLNGHATVVGGHATVGRLSNNVFWTFQAIWENFEKSRWTVTRQWSEVTRPSADCQTTFFGRFKRFGKILKKVAERSRDSGWGHATVGRLSNNVFWTFQAIWENFEKSRWTVTRQWLRSRDRRPTVKQRFLDVSSDLGKFWKKSLNGHATVVEVTRPSADCQTTFFGRFKRFGKILKKVAERSRDSGRRSRDRRPTVKQRFLDVSSDLGKFWKKSLNGHATVVEVTRPSADCQTTFFRRFKRFGKILKKVAERSRDSGWGHATVGRLSNNVFWTFQAIRKFCEKSRWTVTRQWLRSRDRRPTVKQRFLDVSSN